MTIDTETHLTPRRSALDRPTAMRLAATEYQQFLNHLQRLSPDDWSQPTDCPDWDVRAIAGHVVGMAEMAASLRETIRQMVAAKRRGGVMIDALTAIQVEKEAGLGTAELVSLFARIGPEAARARKRTPGIIRNRTMPEGQQVGDRLEQWRFGYLLDVILTRDVWMHRIDIARATGTSLDLTAEHDGVLVDDIVKEWADRHGEPFSLELTGPAGGRWTGGEGRAGAAGGSGPTSIDAPVMADALEFCRALSGRQEVDATRGVPVPF